MMSQEPFSKVGLAALGGAQHTKKIGVIVRHTGVMLKVEDVAQLVGKGAGRRAGGAPSILHNSH